jgi:cytochrome c-type biogenesis protein CcmH
VARLREQVALRPSDLRGHELLAQSEARLGDFAAAHVAQARVIAIKGDDATAEDHVALADLMVTATRGYVSPEAEAALAEALRRDPGNGLARYYSGLMLAQTGRPDLAFRLWRPLVEDSPPGAPWTAALRDQVGEAAALAGVDYDLPPLPAALPGPDADALDAAGALSPEERAEMVAGMVGRLARRLAEDGGTAEEWARLIRAQGVLGNLDAARTVWAEAQAAFAGRDADLALLRDAARAAGVAE